jgi:hypothetical protein
MHIIATVFSIILLGSAVGVRAECPADPVAEIAATCPCDGPPSGAWRNHGKYVSCVVRLRNTLRKDGCLTADVERSIARCAAKSTCGKAGRVLCCYYNGGTCSDPLPGDAVAAGVCSNDGTLACDSATDCVVSHSRIARDETLCVAAGGVAVGGGSLCTACPPPAE